MHTTAGVEHEGAIRHCELKMGSKTGQVEEETIIYNPNVQIFWRMNKDSFGMKKVMSEFIFGFCTHKINDQVTRVEFKQFCVTTNVMKKLLVKFVMTPQMAKNNKILLADFRELVENGENS